MFGVSSKVIPNYKFLYLTIKFYPQQKDLIPHKKFFNTQRIFLPFWGLLEGAACLRSTLQIDREEEGETSSDGEIFQTNFYSTTADFENLCISLDFNLKPRFRQMVIDFIAELTADP